MTVLQPSAERLGFGYVKIQAGGARAKKKKKGNRKRLSADGASGSLLGTLFRIVP